MEFLRLFDEEGRLYSRVGSDGCDYIRSDSFQPIGFANFMNDDAERARSAALAGSEDALNQFQVWFLRMLEVLPSVRHYSWWNMPRKIKSYRGFWQRHWESLFDIKREDTAENNMFFDKPWSEVTDQEIEELSERLQREMGGWVFHRKIDFSRKTPSLCVPNSHPVLAKSWMGGEK